MADSDQERTEQATSKRRSDFRKKGQVAQSKEVGTAALLTFSLLLWVFFARYFWADLGDMLRSILQMLGRFEVTSLTAMNLLWTLAGVFAKALWPIFFLTLIVGFLASFLQVGPLFTLKPFEPDLNKFNVFKGMKKFVSVRSGVELLKSLAKVSLIGTVAYNTVANEFATALSLVGLELSQTVIFLANTAFLVMAKSCGILIVLAVIDYAFSKYEMEKQMKMTKQEVKEEFKETEGDPQIKARVRSMQQQMARKRMMAEVPKADVVITNPTHLSVALKYDREGMDAPTIIAKGGDHLAFRIREIAKEHKVPIVENKPVARALYQHEVGEQIPEDMFKAVAEILAYVYSLKRR